MQTMKINTGIAAKDRATIAKGLSHLLADTYTLYLKTHSFHWNVTGQMFQTLHTRSEEHTSELQSLMRTSYAVFCLNKKQTYGADGRLMQPLRRVTCRTAE